MVYANMCWSFVCFAFQEILPHFQLTLNYHQFEILAANGGAQSRLTHSISTAVSFDHQISPVIST